jgi:diguanylate cyclase (GGDEF)-like protein
VQRLLKDQYTRMIAGRSRLARAFAAIRYDLSWRFARPGAFRQRIAQAVANMPQGICLYDSDNRLQLVNEQFCNIYNQPMNRLRTGMTLFEVLADSCALGNYPGRSVHDIYGARKAFIDRREKGVFLQELGDGRLIAIYHQPLADGGWVCTYEDITERRKAEARIEFMAHHDGLTGLPNRSLFTDRLDTAISHATPGNPCALLCIDLDGFKEVNDRLGHAAGDSLLKNVAIRLKDCVGHNDTAARLGGDEFAVVVPNASTGGALELASHIALSLRHPYFLGVYGSAEITTSIGIAIAPDHATTADELLLKADQSLYMSKNARLGLPVLFNSEVEESSSAATAPVRERWLGASSGSSRRLAHDLAQALRDGCLRLHYQPICETGSGRPVVIEALARWVDPIKGNISPEEFVEAAEEYGLIKQLTEWALTTACQEAARWREDLKVSVNLSPLNLRDASLVDTVRHVLTVSGLPASRLVLELTENANVDRSDDVTQRLHELKAIGVEIWLDDFGSGYANFEYLRHLPCDVVKIDRSFLADYKNQRQLVGGMIALARACGLRVVGEGVETPEHRELLRDLGCDFMQGYLLARPEPPERLRTSLTADVPYHVTPSIAPGTSELVAG